MCEIEKQRIEKPYYTLDMEMNGRSDEMISIGCVYVDERGSDTFYRLVKPRLMPFKMIYRMTGITRQQLEEADEFEKVLQDFINWCKAHQRRKIKMYVWGDDQKIFHRAKQRNALSERLVVSLLNLVEITNIQIAVSSQVKVNGICWRKQIGLLNMANLYQIPLTKQTHNALDDAIVLQWILDAYHNQRDFDTKMMEAIEKEVIELQTRKKNRQKAETENSSN